MNNSITFIIKLIFIIFMSCPLFSQENSNQNEITSINQEKSIEIKKNVSKKKGKYSIQWGYNRANYAPSDITFRGPGYNFTLHDVVAKDKPESINHVGVYVNPSVFSIPQYNYKLTYYLTNKIFISFGQDHMKYVMSPGQSVIMTGYIDPLAIDRARFGTSFDSAVFLYLFPDHLNQFAGYHSGWEQTILTRDFLKFEHTDGLNYLFIENGWSVPIWVSKNGQNALNVMGSIAGGPVICRSDVRLFGEGKNNSFHLSGYGFSTYLAGHFDFLNVFFFELGTKMGYINLVDILTNGRSKDRAKQEIEFMEIVLYAGVKF